MDSGQKNELHPVNRMWIRSKKCVIIYMQYMYIFQRDGGYHGLRRNPSTPYAGQTGSRGARHPVLKAQENEAGTRVNRYYLASRKSAGNG